MLTVSGIGVISKGHPVTERKYGETTYFHLVLVSKNPYKEKRSYSKLSIAVPPDHLEKATDVFRGGNAIQVRLGELAGIALSTGAISMSVNTKWSWIEPIKALPVQE